MAHATAEPFYTYIDGESHYIRSREAWRKLHGPDASLENLRDKRTPDGHNVLVISKAKVFWASKMALGHRRIYFTATTADEEGIHDIRVRMRAFELEPQVFLERKQLANQRLNVLESTQVIEKAKGIDAALAARVLEDCYNDNFNTCHLYTSDVDVLPVVEAVQRRGKKVSVFAYKQGLSSRSPLLYVPDTFIDLEERLARDYDIAE